MNNRYVDRLSQKDSEFEELLCLAYLFTHSVHDEFSEACEILQVDDAELSANCFYN